MDAPSAQLQLELRDSIVKSLATRRPILHHLNADTSWLLQLPRPSSAVKHGGRIYYNILIDPWLQGPQSDVARWFSQQWHAVESAVQSIAEVEEMARNMEILAGGLRPGRSRKSNVQALADIETFIDVVVVSHEFTDHCHKDTLLEVHPDVPVFATEQAAKLISTFNHFRTVTTTPTFSTDSPDWHDYSLLPLPSWLSISRLTATNDALHYHSAILITFATHPFLSATPKKRSSLSIYGDVPSSTAPEAAECVIYTPHGIPYTALAPIAQADPPLLTLAFLHGLHDVSISAAQQLNLGAKNGVIAQRILRAKYWVATHDEVKTGGGLVSWFLKRKIWTVEDALNEARAEMNGDFDMEYDEFRGVKLEDVGNGESRLLE
ncbi:hypothetical protein P280DRAFT_407204 [Massarina eburnea CBS 473.64]|uniref:Metallo-beta-lactamase domain-containing protein n=1 Tax=Massarina eburnea CBS 473.64 TaxID=1395130 RepID=A0A6A6RPB8_9PLEO|nr:hypothetical protein P280DRAFT_407204 [Massarina eburnea CBS 473.64]